MDKKTVVQLVDFADAESFKLALEDIDVVFCAVGTTQKKVKGDKEAYRKVDYDIPVNAARFAKEAGCKQFLLVSSVGANAKSKNFYLQLKGRVEDAVVQQGLPSVSIFRPSMLLGYREEKRPGEGFGKAVMRLLSFMFVGRLKKYRAVHARTVAKAMVYAAKEGNPGVSVYEYKEIIAVGEK